jgi:toxin ParE1/3/4
VKPLLVAQAAEADLRNIGRYTEERWDPAQKQRHLDALRERFAALRHNPALGAARNEFTAGLRSLTAGQHVVFYRDYPDRIEIMRVLHASHDMHRHLDPDPK